MGCNKLYSEYFKELDNLVELLNKYVNSYRLLIGGAYELNNISLAKKSDVKEAVKRADKLGEMIDGLMKIIEDVEDGYVGYVKVKNEYILDKTSKDIIFTEIEDELNFQNSREEIE